MIKAIFIDHTGTVVEERSDEMALAVKRVCQNSNLKNPNELLNVWWKITREYEKQSYMSTYIDQNGILCKIFKKLETDYELNDNIDELIELMHKHWENAPAFEDAKIFFEKCLLPIYVITNNGEKYVNKAMKRNNLSPAAVICSDAALAYKPCKEIFEKALEISNCNPNEVIHIGDSYESDYIGASSAGIKAVLVNRLSRDDYSEDVTTVKDLTQILSLLEKL